MNDLDEGLTREDKDKLLSLLDVHEDGTKAAEGFILKDQAGDPDTQLEFVLDTGEELTWIQKMKSLLRK